MDTGALAQQPVRQSPEGRDDKVQVWRSSKLGLSLTVGRRPATVKNAPVRETWQGCVPRGSADRYGVAFPRCYTVARQKLRSGASVAPRGAGAAVPGRRGETFFDAGGV